MGLMKHNEELRTFLGVKRDAVMGLACACTGWLMPSRCRQVKLPVFFRVFFLVDRLWRR